MPLTMNGICFRYIWFTWRDPRAKQHRQSTQTADLQDAALFRLQFIQKKEERFEELNSPRANYGQLPPKQVADLYFKQKATDHSPDTIARSASEVTSLGRRLLRSNVQIGTPAQCYSGTALQQDSLPRVLLICRGFLR